MSDATPSPDEVRALLRECVTVVRPGELLVIRVPYGTPADEARAYQRVLESAREAWGISAVVVVAEEFGVIPAAGDEAFDKRVMAAINRLDVRADVRGGAVSPCTPSWAAGGWGRRPRPRSLPRVAAAGVTSPGSCRGIHCPAHAVSPRS